jgi:hypothetical protein
MAQENVELVRRTMVEVANRRDVDTLDDLASADYEWHNARDLPGGGVHRGRKAVKAQLRDYLPCVMAQLRVDGFTSLAVVLGVAGVAAGFELADPIVGIGISLVILRIVWQSLRTIGLRAMDGVEAGRSTRSRDPHAASTAGARSPTCGLAGTGMGSARSSRSTSRRTRASQRHTTSPNACATSCRTTYSTSQTSRSRHGRRTRPTAPRRRGAARPRCHRASTAWRPAARPTPDLQRSRLSSISSTPSD